MALNIKNPEADRLARALAARTGETITDAVLNALRERLRREEGKVAGPRVEEELAVIRKRCAALPVLDTRPSDELIGYDRHGLPG